jgi:hypothetical protein
MTRALFVLAAALAVCGCMGGYYEYDYDPWLGPHGHYVGGLGDSSAHRPARRCDRFEGPFYGGYGGPYSSGPICDGPPAAAAAR